VDEQRIAWQTGTWTTPPVTTSTNDAGHLVVTAVEGSDYWQQTVYGFTHENGHALLAPWHRDQAVEVTFCLDGFTELYDQAGLILWNSPTQWIKSGVEINDGVPHLGAVVTDGYSDWSLAPVPEWSGQNITIRASRMNDGVILRAHADQTAWRTIRVARFPHPDQTQAGPFTCAPTRAGLEVTFTRWVHTAPDRDIHTDPS
jgi:uncharacterized protein